MKLDNVLPIDAESARILDRRERRFRWFVGIAAAAWLAALIPTLIVSPLPPLGMFAALAVLMVLAEHRFVLYGDETSMSASIIVVVGAIVICSNASSAIGALMVGSLGGLYVAHLRERAIGKLLINSSIMGLSALCAYVVSSALDAGGQSRVSIPSVLIITTTYWTLNNLAVSSFQVTTQQAPFVRTARCLLFSDTPPLWWAAIAGIGVASTRHYPVLQVCVLGLILALTLVQPWFRARMWRTSARCPTHTSVGALCLLMLVLSRSATPESLALVLTVALMAGWIPPRGHHVHATALFGVLVATLWVPLLGLAVTLAVGVVVILMRRPALHWICSLAFGASAATSFVYGIDRGFSATATAIAVAVASFGTMAITLAAHGAATSRLLAQHHWTVTIGLAFASRRQVLEVSLCCVAGLLGTANMGLGIAASGLLLCARGLATDARTQRTSERASL